MNCSSSENKRPCLHSYLALEAVSRAVWDHTAAECPFKASRGMVGVAWAPRDNHSMEMAPPELQVDLSAWLISQGPGPVKSKVKVKGGKVGKSDPA